MDFATWFRAWMTRHPLKGPSHQEQVGYTAEVMATVKLLAATPHMVHETTRHHLAWWSWPRLALALTAAVGAVTFIIGTQIAPRQFAKRATRDALLLAALEDPAEVSPAIDDVEALADELELTERFLLAESAGEDEQWLEETLQLLQELDDEFSSDPALKDSPDAADPDEWFDELRDLDESDVAASS
jgi:hypothetical protein